MVSAAAVPLVALLVGGAAAVQDWRMLDEYPNHYVTKKLAADEKIVIDGKLDDPAWESAEWCVMSPRVILSSVPLLRWSEAAAACGGAQDIRHGRHHATCRPAAECDPERPAG
jgi:hypothetical protein